MFVRGVDLTLPLDFVREWTESTAKQHWTANVKDCIFTNDDMCLVEDEQPTRTDKGTLIRENSPIIETDVTEMLYQERTYLHASISGIRICLKEGRLQLSFVDIQAVGEHSCLERSLSSEHGMDTEPGNKSTVDNGVSQERDTCNEAISSISFPVAEDKGQDGAESLQLTDPANMDHRQVLQNPVKVDTTRQAETPGKGSSDNPQLGPTTKRKRGRPRKIINTLTSVDFSTTSTLNKISVSAKALPTTRTGYSLRGKKLSPSLFEDSGSEPEEQQDDDEYHPPKGILPQTSLNCGLGTDEESPELVKNQNLSVPDEEKKRYSLEGHEVEGQFNSIEAMQENESRTYFVESATSNEQSEDLKENSIKKKCKRASHSVRSKIDAVMQPAKRQRMRIDVTGLPTYSRRKRNNAKKATCRFCGRKFCDFTGVLMHAKKFHTDMKGLDEYLTEVKGLSAVKCSTCFKEFDNRFQLQLHEDKVHFKAGELPCRHCGKMFSNMVLVKQHIRSVHQVKGQSHACSLCPARFKWATTLKTHVAEVHHGIRDIQCQTCGKKFHRRAQLNRHAAIHGPDNQKLPCPLCGRRFSYTNNLQRHLAIVHPPPQDGAWEKGGGQAWHHCPYCEKGFRRKESLHNHVGKLHFSLYPHHCRLCQAGFQRGSLLEKHMATEHGDSEFQAPSGRRAHFKYNRGEGDELACGMCKENFFYKAQLVEHVLSDHSDSFPYRCETCPRQLFMERSFLVLHRKKAHDIQPEPEDAEFIPEDSSASRGQPQTFAVLEGLDGSPVILHRKPSLSQSFTKKKAKGSTEEGSSAGDKMESSSFPSNSFVIKVENGTNTIQYVIQNPDGDSAEPSEMIVQDIANFLLAANNQSLQEGELTHPGIVLDSGLGQEEGSPPLGSNIIIPQPVVDEDREDKVPNCVLMETGRDSSVQCVDIPAEILVDQGDIGGAEEAVASTEEMEAGSSSGRHAAGNPTQETEVNQMTSSLLAVAAECNMPERIIVTGGDVLQKFTVDSEGLLPEQVMPDAGGADEQTVCLMNTDDIAVGNDSSALSYITMETVASMSVNKADLENLETVYSYPEANTVTIQSPADVALETVHSHSDETESTNSYISMDATHLQAHQKVAVEMVSSHEGISLDSTQSDMAIQPIAVDQLSGNIILGASEVFTAPGASQQIIITMTAVDEENEDVESNQ